MSSKSDESGNARLEQVLAEFLRAAEQGRPISQQVLIAQHPDLADELRSFFSNRAALERLTAQPKQLATENPRPIAGVAFSPDGHRLAAVDTDGNIRVWDATPRAEK